MSRPVLGALLAVSAIVFLLAASISIDAQTTRTLQDGVFSDAQATRGQALYTQRCAGCHENCRDHGHASDTPNNVGRQCRHAFDSLRLEVEFNPGEASGLVGCGTEAPHTFESSSTITVCNWQSSVHGETDRRGQPDGGKCRQSTP